MDARLAKMEKKLGISGGGGGKSKKELKKEKQKAKQEKAEIRQLAAKSLEVGNWTEQLLTGGGEKFSSRVSYRARPHPPACSGERGAGLRMRRRRRMRRRAESFSESTPLSSFPCLLLCSSLPLPLSISFSTVAPAISALPMIPRRMRNESDHPTSPRGDSRKDSWFGTTKNQTPTTDPRNHLNHSFRRSVSCAGRGVPG